MYVFLWYKVVLSLYLSLLVEPPIKLQVSYFESDIDFHSRMFHAGTRQWLFDEIETWRLKTRKNQNSPNICMITGNPGMGKTVVAAKISSQFKSEGRLAGCFFFQYHIGKRSNPKMLVQSLCHQFRSSLNGYADIVEEDITTIDPDSLSVSELFAYLIKEPLSRISEHPDSMVIVIDALDECDYDARPDLLRLIVRDFLKLPQWIQVVVTSRPDEKILRSLKKIKSVIKISPHDPRNLEDIRLFLSDFLKNLMSKEEFCEGVELLLKKSEGMFLYFFYAIDMLEDQETLSLDELKSLLPDGIDDYYHHNFKRLKDSLGKEHYQLFLQGILMARADFPQDLLSSLLGITKEGANKIISVISTLFPIHNHAICIFHKSVKDWLLDEDMAEEYAVDTAAGHVQLAKLCERELKSLKSIFSSLPFIEACNNRVYQFVVNNIVYHTCQTGDMMKALSIIEDIHFMYLSLVYGDGTTSNLLECITEALKVSKSKKIYQRLLECYNFIRRHSHILEGNSSLLFQCALNESDLFSKRLGIGLFLANPRNIAPSLIALLQVKNKAQQAISAMVTFTASDDITSCLVLHDVNRLVCSTCNKIQYWDIHTGEKITTVDLGEEYSFLYSINSCSVAANNGMIAHASLTSGLNAEGDKISLLNTKAKRDCNICIFSPDGEKLLSMTFVQEGLFRLLKEIQIPMNFTYHVELWTVSDSSRKVLHSTKEKDSRPTCACFSADGKKIFCGHRNGVIIQWDTDTCLASAYLFSPDLVLKNGMLTMQCSVYILYVIVLF